MLSDRPCAWLGSRHNLRTAHRRKGIRITAHGLLATSTVWTGGRYPKCLQRIESNQGSSNYPNYESLVGVSAMATIPTTNVEIHRNMAAALDVPTSAPTETASVAESLPIPESLTAWVGQYHAAKAISSNLRAVSRDLASAVLLVACQLWNRSTINRRLGTPRSSTHTSSETILFNLRITNVIKFNIKRSSSCPTTYQCLFP